MRQKPGTRKSHGEKVVNDIRRATRKQYSAEEKTRIVLDGLKSEDHVRNPCPHRHPRFDISARLVSGLERGLHPVATPSRDPRPSG